MLTAMPTPLITATELNQLLSQGTHDVVLFDCSFDLADPPGARPITRAPAGAYYLHLDNELSGPKTGLQRPVIRCPMRSCSPRGCGRLA